MKEIIIAIITILPTMATLVVTTIVNSKVKKQNEFQADINNRFDKLEAKINDNRKKALRNILVNDYTDLIKGKKKSKEQLQNISDMYEEYHEELKGDTYVEDLHDIWKEKFNVK
jgi:hypothetical protein